MYWLRNDSMLCAGLGLVACLKTDIYPRESLEFSIIMCKFAWFFCNLVEEYMLQYKFSF